MRINIEFEVTGNTVLDIVHAANETWRELTESDDDLPSDTEINVEPSEATDYKALVFARMKINNE